MSYNTAEIQAQLAQKRSQLAAANAAYEAALGNSEVQTYRFSSGEGDQSTTRRKPAEIRVEIKSLEQEIKRLERRLSGGGLCTMNLRRNW